LTSDEIKNLLSKYGEVELKIKKYNTFRGSKNLRNRETYVNELLWILKK